MKEKSPPRPSGNYPTTQELIDAVKKFAQENYGKKYGWSEIIECFEDNDIKEEFLESRSYGSYVIPQAFTIEDAIRRATEYVDIKEERYREAVGPDVICDNCGKVYQYECGHACRES
jgi:hypothetical protein